MAGPAGLEPVTSRVTGECSNQLSYGPKFAFALNHSSFQLSGVRALHHSLTYVHGGAMNPSAASGSWCLREELHL